MIFVVVDVGRLIVLRDFVCQNDIDAFMIVTEVLEFLDAAIDDNYQKKE